MTKEVTGEEGKSHELQKTPMVGGEKRKDDSEKNWESIPFPLHLPHWQMTFTGNHFSSTTFDMFIGAQHAPLPHP